MYIVLQALCRVKWGAWTCQTFPPSYCGGWVFCLILHPFWFPSYACPFCVSASCSSLWTLDHHLRIVHQATIQAKPATVNVSLKLSSFGLGYDSWHALLICLHAAEGVPLCDVQQHLVKCAHHVVTESLHALLSNTAIADAEDPLPGGRPVRCGHSTNKCQLESCHCHCIIHAPVGTACL